MTFFWLVFSVVITNRKPWTSEQLKLAFYLYCQIPFGKLHYRNPKIVRMANFIGRTSSALAMKLVNFASLDPVIQSGGRKGLGNASCADKEIWEEFHNDWEKLTSECEILLQNINTNNLPVEEKEKVISYNGGTRDAIVSVRIGQQFFRKSVLSSYQNICCISGVSLSQLLVASHIIPWSKSKENRLNPSNGLCLSAIHDKAFDQGFLTVTSDYTILVSELLKQISDGNQQMKLMVSSDKKKIILPQKFLPNKDFLEWHNKNIFLR
jgi:predicted restriction endonuclease